MKEIYFVTTNAEKFRNAENFFKTKNLDTLFQLSQHKVSVEEIQDPDPENIALHSAKYISKKLGAAVITSDVGFFIPSLNNFPGPYIRYMNKWFSQEQLLKLMEDITDRNAYFVDCLAYADPNGNESAFCDRTIGMLADNPSTKTEWTIDGLFIPEGFDKPLAEMTEEERLKVWNTEKWENLHNFLISLDN